MSSRHSVDARCRARTGTVTFWAAGFVSISLVISLSLYFFAWGDSDASTVDVLAHTVERGTFLLDVVEEGEIESSSNVEIRCEVESLNSAGTMIIEVVDEGTYAKKGDVLVRLDSSALEQDRIQQQILCNSAEAKMVQSKNTWEAAEIAYKEYVEGTFHQEEQTIQSEIFIAEENLRRAQEYVKYSQRLAARGYVTAQQLEGDQFAVEKAKTELATATTKLRVLQEYTKPKMMKQLESDIRTAQATFAADQSSYELELNKLRQIESQIEKCTIRAPQAGQVVYANQEGRRGDDEFVVEPGAMAREGQVIVRLPDPSQMQVKADISESRVNMVKVGMPVAIRLDALGDLMLRGRVTRVNEYPEPTGWFSSQVKEYATLIEIIDPPNAIRPGLTAEVTIHAARRTNVVIVPVQAVYEHGRDLYCFVKQGVSWEARKVVIGGTNDTYVHIEAGVEPGDSVAMAPRTLLRYVDLPELKEVDRPNNEEDSDEVDANDSQGNDSQGNDGQTSDNQRGDEVANVQPARVTDTPAAE